MKLNYKLLIMLSILVLTMSFEFSQEFSFSENNIYRSYRYFP